MLMARPGMRVRPIFQRRQRRADRARDIRVEADDETAVQSRVDRPAGRRGRVGRVGDEVGRDLRIRDLRTSVSTCHIINPLAC